MKIREIKDILGATVLCCDDKLDDEVYAACASDMMSDVLAHVKNQAVLITGLCNPQVVRTAEMMDMRCIVLVRGKNPEPIIVELAKERGIVLMCSPIKMFGASGMLYQAGLKPDLN